MDSNVLGYVLAIAGFFLCFISYVMYIPEVIEHVPTVIGMVLVASGYAILFIHKIYALHIKTLETKKKQDDVSKLKRIATIMDFTGYVLLAIFFFGIHVFPALTFRVRFYDVFAAIGYFVGMFTKTSLVPVWVAFAPLVIYYVFAGSVKVFEHGIIEKIQLVGRLLLAAYYGFALTTSVIS